VNFSVTAPTLISPIQRTFQRFTLTTVFFYASFTAANPSINYALFGNRMKVPFLTFSGDLSGFPPAAGSCMAGGLPGSGKHEWILTGNCGLHP
jgi:hypothetical protein